MGIEMAAAWVQMLTCQEIADEIEHDLDFLTLSWRGKPDRHRSLRAVFEHSWRLLTPQERNGFVRLSVFQGGFERAAAREVTGTSLTLLTSLVGKSLVHRISANRFEIHPVLQKYVAEKLTEDPSLKAETSRSLASYYVTWLEDTFVKFKGGEQITALAAMRLEMPNIHTTWQNLVERHDFDGFRRILSVLILFHEMNDRRIGAQATTQFLCDMADLLRQEIAAEKTSQPVPERHGLLALTLAALHQFTFDPASQEVANKYLEESMAVIQGVPDCLEKGYTLMLNFNWPGSLSNEQEAELSQECIQLFESFGDAWDIAMVHEIHADFCNIARKDFDQARQHYQFSMDIFIRIHNEWGQAVCKTGLSMLERQLGNLEEAYRLARESLAIFVRLGNEGRLMEIRFMLGEIFSTLGRMDEACQYLQANLDFFTRQGRDNARAYCIEQLKALECDPNG